MQLGAIQFNSIEDTVQGCFSIEHDYSVFIRDSELLLIRRFFKATFHPFSLSHDHEL